MTSGSPTNSSIFGEAGNDTLDCGDGNDSLDGGGGDDVLRDSAGTNHFTSGAGADHILPGDGNATGDLDTADTLDYAGATPGGFEINYNDYSVVIRRTDGTLGSFQFERGGVVRIIGTEGDDAIRARGFDTSVDVHGGAGHDAVHASRQSSDSFVRAFGDAGNDTITFIGEDLITDSVSGGSGDDHLVNESSFGLSENIDGGSGYDSIECNFVSFEYSFELTIPRGVEAISAYLGLTMSDQSLLVIHGNDLPNLIEATADFCRIYGAGGNDTIIAGNGIDHIEGNAGNDSIIGNAGDDRIFGGSGNDTLIGGAGRDLLHGQAGNDFIDAFDGGIDTIDGGAGVDRADRDPLLDLVSEVEIFV